VKASTLYVAIGSRLDHRVDDTMLLPGENNVTCDILSRGASPSELGMNRSLFAMVK